jgi:hypothetical protein
MGQNLTVVMSIKENYLFFLISGVRFTYKFIIPDIKKTT